MGEVVLCIEWLKSDLPVVVTSGRVAPGGGCGGASMPCSLPGLAVWGIIQWW